MTPFKNMPRKKQIKLSVIFLLLGLGSIIGSIAGIANSKSKNPEPEPVVYQTVKIKKSDPLLLKGNVDASRIDEIYLEESLGELETISVETGQEVKAGDRLLTYENSAAVTEVNELTRSLNKAYLARNNAQSAVDKGYQKRQELVNELYSVAVEEQEAVNQLIAAQDEVIYELEQVLEGSQLDVDDMDAALGESQDQLTPTVEAEMDGTVYVNTAGEADATIPIVQIISPDVLVKGQVSEYDYTRLQLGQPVTIIPVTPTEKVSGKITQIDQLPQTSATAEGASTPTIVTYSFSVTPDTTVQYGYSVQISLPINELSINQKAVVEDEGEQFVFLYQAGKVEKQGIKTVEARGNLLVTEGVKAGDVIISNPDKKLTDGDKVEVRK